MSFNHIVVKNIMRDKSTYISYFLSSMFSILIFFLFSITAFHPMIIEIDTTATLGIVMLLASFFIYIFSFIFIIYSLFAFLKKKKKTLGTFMMMGASLKQVRKMVFRENMIIAGMAIITAIVCGLVIAPLFLMIAKKVFRANIFSMYIPVEAIIVTIVLFSLLFTIVTKLMTYLIKKEEIVQLLKADITQEKRIKSAPIKLTVSIIVSTFMLFSILKEMDWTKSFETLPYIVLFISLLLTIYFIVTQGMIVGIHLLQKHPSYLRKTNMFFVSNIKAKERSHAHIIYLLTILLLGVFVCSSVLYSSYYSTKEKTEKLYPYSFQYISHPGDESITEKNIEIIESTLDDTEDSYESYYSAFKTDDARRIAFMSVSKYNQLGEHPPLELDNNEYFVVAGNEGVLPSKESIHDYSFGKLEYSGTEQKNLLITGLQNVYYVVPDKVYKTIEYPESKIFAYELDDWTEKTQLAETILSKVNTEDDRPLTSKIELYESEKFLKSIMFFIGFMLSMIFMSAAMSILYFYLQTSLESEKEKFLGIRKIGFSIKELTSVVTKELVVLIFVPFTIATLFLFITLISIDNRISLAFYQLTAVGLGLFLLLFIISFFFIRKMYIDKLLK